MRSPEPSRFYEIWKSQNHIPLESGMTVFIKLAGTRQSDGLAAKLFNNENEEEFVNASVKPVQGRKI